MQSNNARDKKQGDEAVDKIEKWNLRQYFFNMLQYAAAKRLPWPRIDLTLNGQMLFRLEIADDDGTLEFVLKYFGAQEMFIVGAVDAECLANCRFRALPDEGEEGKEEEAPFSACPLDQQFAFVLDDADSPSRLCYAATFTPLSLPVLEKVFSLVHEMFRLLESKAAGADAAKFLAAPQWSVERLFYSTMHDIAAVAIELKGEKDEIEKADDGAQQLSSEKIAALETEWKQVEQEVECRAKSIGIDTLISSCQLHADIWQYNDRHRITAVGRQYENIARLQRLGDAMHVPFRGAADDMQKKIYVGEFLVKMLPTICLALAEK